MYYFINVRILHLFYTSGVGIRFLTNSDMNYLKEKSNFPSVNCDWNLNKLIIIDVELNDYKTF